MRVLCRCVFPNIWFLCAELKRSFVLRRTSLIWESSVADKNRSSFVLMCRKRWCDMLITWPYLAFPPSRCWNPSVLFNTANHFLSFVVWYPPLLPYRRRVWVYSAEYKTGSLSVLPGNRDVHPTRLSLWLWRFQCFHKSQKRAPSLLQQSKKSGGMRKNGVYFKIYYDQDFSDDYQNFMEILR